MSGVH